MAAKKKDQGASLSCSFCGKSQEVVKKLVAALTFIYVMNALNSVMK